VGNAISEPVFAAFLKCETKAYLLQHGIPGPISETEALRRSLDAGFKLSGSERLRARVPEHEVLVGTPVPEILRAGIYSLIIGPTVRFSQGIAHPDALQRLSLPGARGRATYRPVQFSRTEKPTTADKLRLAFDAIAVAEMAGKVPSTGGIIYGPRYAEQGVPVTKLVTRARGILKAAGVVLANTIPPVLGLNKHCSVCEFQARCRKAAIEADDLSLLPTMSAKRRHTKIRKGILTVTQLSYTRRGAAPARCRCRPGWLDVARQVRRRPRDRRPERGRSRRLLPPARRCVSM
jgi:predicted RecB family nuclease